MSSSDAAILALGLSAVMVVVLILAFYVLIIVAYWKMFTKAGEKGWKSIIPIYNLYVAFRIAWKDKKAFWIFLISSIIYSIGYSVMGSAAAADSTGGTIVAGIIAFAAAVICIIWDVRFCIKQAHAYNKGTGCGVLAIFFPNIMTLYYGFASSATYQGAQD